MFSLFPKEVQSQVAQALAVLHAHLNETTVAVHLFGSAVDGGLHPFSDLDLLATVNKVPPAATGRNLLK